MDFEQMVVENVWHSFNDLDFIFKNIQAIVRDKKWSWIRNPRAKYIDIRIDMRDGGFVLLDQDRVRISLDQILDQNLQPRNE